MCGSVQIFNMKEGWNPKLSDEENRLIDEALPFVTSDLKGKTLSGDSFEANLNSSIIVPMTSIESGGTVQFMYHDSAMFSFEPKSIEICHNGTCLEVTIDEIHQLLFSKRFLKGSSSIGPIGK
jgi:hypothetical protein